MSMPHPRQRVVLAGAGHTQLLVIEQLIQHPRPDLEWILITPSPSYTYSGMFPGWLAGDYSVEEAQLDLQSLTKRAGVCLCIDSLVAMDAARNCIILQSGSELCYDFIVLAVGSETDDSWLLDLPTPVWPLQPVSRLMAAWQTWSARSPSYPWNIAVIGAGAAGVEVCMALHDRWPQADVSLVTGHHGLLPGHGQGAKKRAQTTLERAGVHILAGRAVGTAAGIMLAHNNQILAVDTIIAATGARPPIWLRLSHLQLDAEGKVLVDAHHRSVSHSNVWVAGDACARSDTRLPSSGVHAVHAGAVVAYNLMAALQGRQAYRSYRPRRWTLYLIRTHAQHAIASWGPFSAQGAWVRRWKDHLDRKFLRRFRQLTTVGDPICPS